MKSDSSKRFIYPGIPAMWAVLSLLVLFSCGGRSNKKADGKVKDSGHTFILPEIPPALNERESRAEYLVLHYWDNFDFSDTLVIRDAEIAEQAFVDYIVLLPHTAKAVADASIRSTLENARGAEAVHPVVQGDVRKVPVRSQLPLPQRRILCYGSRICYRRPAGRTNRIRYVRRSNWKRSIKTAWERWRRILPIPLPTAAREHCTASGRNIPCCISTIRTAPTASGQKRYWNIRT